MELVRILKRLAAMRRLVAVGAILAVVVGLASVYRLSLAPLKLEAKTLDFGAASTQFLVDTRQSGLTDNSTDPSFLVFRAEVYARVIGSDSVRAIIARRMGPGVNPDDIVVTTKANRPQVLGAVEPTADQRAKGLLPGTGLSVTTQAELGLPIVTVATKAATGDRAKKLADAAVAGLAEYLVKVPAPAVVSPATTGAGKGKHTVLSGPAGQILIRQVGRAVGGQATKHSGSVTMVLVAAGTFILWCMLILLGSSFRREWRRQTEEECRVWAEQSGVAPPPFPPPAGADRETRHQPVLERSGARGAPGE